MMTKEEIMNYQKIQLPTNLHGFTVIATEKSKTNLACSWLLQAAIDRKEPCALFSLECDNKNVMRHLLLQFGHDEESVLRLRDAPIQLDDTPRLSALEFKEKAAELVQQHDVKLIIVSNLRLMTAGDLSFTSNEEREDYICKILNETANDLNIPIIAFRSSY